MDPARNVELKARDPDPAATRAAALALGAREVGTLHQRDTYFDTPSGRLKLREQDGVAQLIAYDRADAAVARLSNYRIAPVGDPDALASVLEAALGTTQVVEKSRDLLLFEGVRIHLDDVAGLGRWVELEAVADPESDLQAEHAKVARIRQALDLTDDRLVAEGYAQLLAQADAAGLSVADDAAAHTQRELLVTRARDVRERAFVPYSRFGVGAALLGDDGEVHVGANVENAAYPQGQCAEASAIGALIAAGASRVLEVAVMADTELITPCGGCRQRLSEFTGPEVHVHLCGPEGVRRTVTMGELLPFAFAARDLEG